MYRNCVFNNKTRKLHLFTWDSQGNRIREDHDYRPYLLLEDKRGDEKSIYGTTLKRKEFNSSYDRNNFVKDSGIKRIFENLPPYQQYLIDNFWHSSENEEFSQHPIKVCYVDIENPHPDFFPDVELANTEINLMTCYDSLTKRYTSFGIKPYDSKGRDDVDYHYCKTEKELLKKFIGHFSNDFPDVICGWNSNGYDIPYLINRITNELGKGWADELSPIGRIYEKINQKGKFGQPSKEYVIEGISCLDYQIMYQKFKISGKPENYKLNTVGEHELNISKIDYKGSLWDLSESDWDTYVDYNIRDIELIVKLDEKLDYIALIRFLAYNGLCNLDKAVTTVPVINGAIAIKARARGECIPTFVRTPSGEKNPGGYVQETKSGFVENVVSFDANSLYPSVMISLNISPETKLGRYEKVGDMINFYHVSGKKFELTPQKFAVYIREEKAAISKSNHLFSQKKLGIMPEFLDALYTKRKEMRAKGKDLYKKLMKIKKTLSKEEISKMEFLIQKYDTFQNSYKILLNSVYGYTGNAFAPLGDDDIASSVTLSGQAINKKNKSLFMGFLMTRFGISEDEAESACIAGDTDSGYFSLKPLISLGYPLLEDGEIGPKFLDVCDQLETYINQNISEWVDKTFKSIDSRIVYKRESICDKGIFLAKKHYVLHVLDDEGVKVDKFKYVGVAVVKGTMPKAIKPYVKKVIEHMVMTRSLKETNEVFNEAYEVFKSLPVWDISKNTGVNNYEKMVSQCDGLRTLKGMPAHAKAAYFHDYVVDNLNLKSKYTKFRSGDKVRSVQVKTPNRYNVSNIGFKDKYPEEFNDVFKVDYELMFHKVFFEAIDSCYKAVNWNLRKPSENLRVELDELFGE